MHIDLNQYVMALIAAPFRLCMAKVYSRIFQVFAISLHERPSKNQ
jgi:hypothetical protein